MLSPQNVFVTCYLKTFGHKGELPWASGTTKSLAVLLCRSEDIKGMPEICFGAYVESYTDMQCRFLRIDIRLGKGCNNLTIIQTYTVLVVPNHVFFISHLSICVEENGYLVMVQNLSWARMPRSYVTLEMNSTPVFWLSEKN